MALHIVFKDAYRANPCFFTSFVAVLPIDQQTKLGWIKLVQVIITYLSRTYEANKIDGIINVQVIWILNSSVFFTNLGSAEFLVIILSVSLFNDSRYIWILIANVLNK